MAGSLESRGNVVMLINYQQRRAKASINRPQAISRCLFLYPFPLHTHTHARARIETDVLQGSCLSCYCRMCGRAQTADRISTTGDTGR